MSVLFLEAALLFALSVPRIRCITVEAQHYPIAAVTTLKAAGVTGRIATFFDWGGFVLDTLGPELQVSMDPRRETVYGAEAYGINEQFTLGLGDWDALLVREPPPDLALVSKAFPTFNLMRSHPGWSLVVEDQGGGLFVRDDSKVAAAVRHGRRDHHRVCLLLLVEREVGGPELGQQCQTERARQEHHEVGGV